MSTMNATMSWNSASATRVTCSGSKLSSLSSGPAVSALPPWLTQKPSGAHASGSPQSHMPPGCVRWNVMSWPSWLPFW
ncbi:TPA: hypothetical protein N0F65_006696 [Lagenidium giganteum]|uniref:Uncharacterized protein n=1 Tax=Lagenidium giganteum TaxID=4803 RepID=A0AAV2Z3L2_9STRA|nr:TPA: hypothetical protein N0F65_006696 [Lagenidium giganteum]